MKRNGILMVMTIALFLVFLFALYDWSVWLSPPSGRNLFHPTVNLMLMVGTYWMTLVFSGLFWDMGSDEELDYFLGCPHCGGAPAVNTKGSQVYVECCSTMSIQKSDYLDREERETLNYNKLVYSDEAEAKVLKILRDKWNKRV